MTPSASSLSTRGGKGQRERKKNMAKNHLLLLLVAITLGHVLVVTEGVSLDHIVGGALGWRLPPNDTFYQEWAGNRTFVVGDKLVFMYTPALQSVIEVSSQKDFDECTEKNLVNKYYLGPTVLEITEAGDHYYYCGIGTHCEGAQKLSISVSATPVHDPARDGLSASAGDVAGSVKEGTGQSGATSGASGCRRVGVIAGLLIPWFMALLI